ncbi:MAG: biotin--acetyl-CoA-carboxylase ligase [Clostridia bacterium BRH_c25]|nr:MAG: biotin--acetyl-CoA-carboxylase ligase [Clostridia bacterium BRH_c25]
MKNKILEELKANNGQAVSGEDISRRLGISRTAVWKHIKRLRDEGYSIESQTNSGYRLVGSPDVLSFSELEPFLHTKCIGRNIIYLDNVTSTNTYAKKAAEKPFQEGTVVIAEEQTGGKGRLGRHWVSPRGKGIWMSIMLKPDILPNDAPKLTIAAALAVVKALWSCCRLEARIKWPNDITAGGKKLCGILTEMSAEADEIKHVIIGIGINANLELEDFGPEVSSIATSVKLESGNTVLRKDLAASVLYEFEEIYKVFVRDGSIKFFLNEYKDKSAVLGKEIRVISKKEEITGLAVDISEDGHLVVKLADGSLREIMSGEVSVRSLCGYI